MGSLSLVLRILVMVLVVGHVMSVGTAYAQQWVWRMHASGASVYFDCEISGWCHSHLTVGESFNLLDRSQSSASMEYLVNVDGTLCLGYLLIPQESYKKIGENGKATLYVDTTTLPYFSRLTCTPVVNGSCYGTWVPGGPVGIIEINWTPNGEYRGEYTTFYRQFYSSDPAPALYKELSTESSASATGVIFGSPISGGGVVNGLMGQARWP